jgi:hypothetical protein
MKRAGEDGIPIIWWENPECAQELRQWFDAVWPEVRLTIVGIGMSGQNGCDHVIQESGVAEIARQITALMTAAR